MVIRRGIYSIIFTPESKQISEAVENNGYIRFYIPDYELSVTDSNNKEIPYSKIHPDKNIAYSGQSELKVYMEKGRHYRMIAGKNSNVTVSDKASLSQCKVSCKRNYAFNGKAVTPEISFEYDGKVLKEGTDYKLTVLNNTEPGIMFAIAEGTGNYCGFMNFAMAIEGGGVTCSEFNSMNVMDISTDQEFALENISKYRLTLDKDTWIKIESNISEWIGIDYYSIDDINEKSDNTYMYPDSDYILLKKGTWILSFDAFRDGTTETVIKAKLKTNDSIKSISDASVEITYNNEPINVGLYTATFASISGNFDIVANTIDFEIVSRKITVVLNKVYEYTGSVPEYELTNENVECFKKPSSFRTLKDAKKLSFFTPLFTCN